MADAGTAQFVVDLVPASEYRQRVAREFYKALVHLVYDEGVEWEDAVVKVATSHGVFGP